MKAILVIDNMPNECMECPLRFKDGDTDDWFRFRCHISTDQVEKGKRLESCPLKQMPERFISRVLADTYEDGWNACIDEITGGEEHE